MNSTQFLANLQRSRYYRHQIEYIHSIPAREASFKDLEPPLPEALQHVLLQMGIERLYTHQAESIEKVRDGKSVVIVTSTASGKTLCYNIPVLETLLNDPKSKALYLFPTKALAQDQLRGLRRYGELEPSLGQLIKAGTYDGDTPPTTRRKLRDEASIILTNPDMLHQGIIPYHTRWSRFFTNLRYIVIDEIHTYRGIFGSNVSQVIRRLNRICQYYGSNPQFICSSATVANPLDLSGRLTGVGMDVIDNDGSPRGAKQFVLWNPPTIDAAGMERKSSNVEAQDLIVELMRSGIRTIAFGRARIVAELMYRYIKDFLEKHDPALANKIRAYRGGYLPEERREIERRLFSGELMGITSTNALELGIDIGGLDAAIIVGFPGTIASTRQQAGRAGRGANDSLVFFVGYNDPIDQYLMRHPEYFFEQSPENAVVDPENPYVLANHLRCAAFELPVREDRDSAFFGSRTGDVARILEESGDFKGIDNSWYWSNPEFPAKDVNLRTTSDNTFAIVNTSDGNKVIGQVDSISAPELVYPQAIYMHDADTYLVDELDLQGRIAYVRRAEVDYYTNAILDASIRIGEAGSEKTWGGCKVCCGEATVTWATTGFKKIKFYSVDSIGYGKVDIPPQNLETIALWITPSEKWIADVRALGKNPIEGLMGIRNLLVHALPLFAMSDKQDIGGIVDSSNTGLPTIFIYDRYAGGMGYAEKGYEMVEELVKASFQMVTECGCEDGCPSCVGMPTLRPAIHTDPDVFGSFPIPDKETASMLLHEMLGRTWCRKKT